MAELAKKLHFKKDGVEQNAKAYSNTAEVGEHWVNAKIDSVLAYVAIGDIADSRATSGRVKGSGGDSYAILNSGKVPYNKVEYRTPGIYTVTIPPGAYTAKLTLAGGGGGGGGYAVNDYAANGSGGSGGAGNLYVGVVSVIPGTYQVQVGAGGTAGKNNVSGNDYEFYGGAGSQGNASTFGSYISIGGNGGGGGHCWSSNSGSNGSNGSAGGNGYGASGGSGGYVKIWSDDGGNHVDKTYNAVAGSPGWVIIEYGGDI